LPNHNRWLHVFFFAALLTVCACHAKELQEASISYKTNKDYASLAVLAAHLRKGMARTEVEALLGEADYSPIEGQDYYSSGRREHKGSGKEQITLPVGLVADYRDEQDRLTKQLQTFWLGRIGE
jgi:hypothetical protein